MLVKGATGLLLWDILQTDKPAKEVVWWRRFPKHFQQKHQKHIFFKQKYIFRLNFYMRLLGLIYNNDGCILYMPIPKHVISSKLQCRNIWNTIIITIHHSQIIKYYPSHGYFDLKIKCLCQTIESKYVAYMKNENLKNKTKRRHQKYIHQSVY